MAIEIHERTQYAVVTKTDVILESTLSYSRKSAIDRFITARQADWKVFRKQGFYTAKISIYWEKTVKD